MIPTDIKTIEPEFHLRRRPSSFSAFHLVSMNGKLYTLSLTSEKGQKLSYHTLDETHWKKLALTVEGIFHSTSALSAKEKTHVNLLEKEIKEVHIPLLSTKAISFQNSSSEKKEELSKEQMSFLRKDHLDPHFRHDFIKELNKTLKNPTLKIFRFSENLPSHQIEEKKEKLSNLQNQINTLSPALKSLKAPLYSSLTHKKENPASYEMNKEEFETISSLFKSEDFYFSSFANLNELIAEEEKKKTYLEALKNQTASSLYLPLDVSLQPLKGKNFKQDHTLGLFIDRKAKKIYLYDSLGRKIKDYQNLAPFLLELKKALFEDAEDVKMFGNANKQLHQSYHPRSQKEKSLHDSNVLFEQTPNERYNCLRYQFAFLQKMQAQSDKDKAFSSFTHKIFHREHLELFCKEFAENTLSSLYSSYTRIQATGK